MSSSARVASNIATALEVRGMTKDEFGAAMGWRSRATTWRKFKAVHPFTFDEVEQAAEILGVPVSEVTA